MKNALKVLWEIVQQMGNASTLLTAAELCGRVPTEVGRRGAMFFGCALGIYLVMAWDYWKTRNEKEVLSEA